MADTISPPSSLEQYVPLEDEENDESGYLEYLQENYPLHYACKVGDHAEVKRLLGGKTQLERVIFAEEEENEESSKRFYDIVPRRRPLHYACMNNTDKCESEETSIVRLLLSVGIQLFPFSSSESTPLHYACSYGNYDIIKHICSIYNGMCLLTDRHWTPLHNFLKSGKYLSLTEAEIRYVIDLYIKSKCNYGYAANLNATTQYNDSILDLALKSEDYFDGKDEVVVKKYKSVINYLTHCGFKVNSSRADSSSHFLIERGILGNISSTLGFVRNVSVKGYNPRYYLSNQPNRTKDIKSPITEFPNSAPEIANIPTNGGKRKTQKANKKRKSVRKQKRRGTKKEVPKKWGLF